jgi:hypothetical protein
LASESQATTHGWAAFFSSALRGLQRTATWTLVPFALLLLLAAALVKAAASVAVIAEEVADDILRSFSFFNFALLFLLE